MCGGGGGVHRQVTHGGDPLAQNFNRFVGCGIIFLCPLFTFISNAMDLVSLFNSAAMGGMKEIYEE